MSDRLNTDYFDSFAPDTLYCVPLGGAGEFGVNMTAYGYNDQWLIVDCGLGFADDSLPGIDIVLPDPAFMQQRKDKIVGLVITHGHEDHIGAIGALWPFLLCPIYATRFTAALIRSRLREYNIHGRADVTEFALNSHFVLGPFALQSIAMTHSVPESQMLVIKTDSVNVLHTGDWKIDPGPVVGGLSNIAALQNLAHENITAVIGDSTNSLTAGHAGSEADLQTSLISLFGQFKERVVITSFASNVARLQSICAAAHANGRVVGLVGRSLWRIVDAAKQAGYLADLPDFLRESDIMAVPRHQAVIICTGSQGEGRAALSRVARQEHPQVKIQPGDACIFSARPIPGNEKDILRVQKLLSDRGIQVVTEADHFVHVSGHPCQDDLRQLYNWVKPAVCIPVHGERDHMAGHVKLAQECGVGHAVMPSNGDVIAITPQQANIVGQVHTGLLCVDGKKIVPFNGTAIHGRNKMAEVGSALISLVLSREGELIADPQIKVMGVLSDDEDAVVHGDLVQQVIAAVEDLSDADILSDTAVQQAARVALRRAINNSHGKKPVTEVHVIRLAA